ncbi:AzlC family ABC transporter permease [Acidimicrobiia bacterium EGI L10123]|uniref:AzlC family ABC transporter permease n=1 Tax=Salinilacustrithrix flava TaxID=2957203 RepID=UPI003D7C172E|nr:AzlC family ABC transporter permease [Acidimicrobiia bacterium EGI L10123]
MTSIAVGRRIDREALSQGAGVALSLALGYVPFALALGATFAATDLDPLVAWSSSWLVFAGAAQATAVSLLDAGAAPTVVVLSCLVMNARHLLYGASLRPHMDPWSRRTRAAGAYFLTDAVYAIAAARFEEGPGAEAISHRSFYFGAGLTAWVSWVALTGAGVTLADSVPAVLRLDLAAPLTFVLLLLPLLSTRAAKVSAVAAGSTVAVGATLPMGIGLLAGIAAGVAAGSLTGDTT